MDLCVHCGMPVVLDRAEQLTVYIPPQGRICMLRTWTFCASRAFCRLCDGACSKPDEPAHIAATSVIAECRDAFWSEVGDQVLFAICGPDDKPECTHCGGPSVGEYVCRTQGHVHVGDSCTVLVDGVMEEGIVREVGTGITLDLTKGFALNVQYQDVVESRRTPGHECPHCDADGTEAPDFYCSHDEKHVAAGHAFDQDITIRIYTGRQILVTPGGASGFDIMRADLGPFGCPHDVADWWNTDPETDGHALPPPGKPRPVQELTSPLLS